MSDELYTCGICDKDIVIEYIDDIHSDDSGEYHYDCHQDWAHKEAAFWYTQYQADPLKLSKEETLAAYDPGSAKRYALEMELQ